MRIPLLRHGREYESLDVVELGDHRTGAVVARVSQANPALIRQDARRTRAARLTLAALPARRLLAICAEAGARFMNDTLRGMSPLAFVEAQSSTTGLPHALCRRNMAKVRHVLQEMEWVLRGLTRGLDLEVIDRGRGEQAGVPVAFHAVADSLGVILPSNSPGVNALWLPALALKVPVALKPGKSDPWTPDRIALALLAAGLPPEAISVYPADHQGAQAVLETSGRTMLFGDEKTIAAHAADPRVDLHGPGRSKVILGEDAIDAWPEHLDVLVASILENGGRSCTNASTIVVPRLGDAVADALARRLAAVRPLAPEDPAAALAAFPDPAVARAIDGSLDHALPGAEDWTARYRSGPRLVKQDGATYLLPTLVRCSSQHPLARRELLFPFASVVEIAQGEIAASLGPTLVATVISRDEALIRALLDEASIGRLNLGAIPTTTVRWDQPHEGNLFELLYRRRAIQS